jgi:transposase
MPSMPPFNVANANFNLHRNRLHKIPDIPEGLPAEVVIADTAYDADHLRQDIAAKKALAVIPNNPSRALRYPLDKHLYAQRYLVECCFSKLKQFRRVATRFEKTARNYQAVVTLAAIVLWMR